MIAFKWGITAINNDIFQLCHNYFIKFWECLISFNYLVNVSNNNGISCDIGGKEQLLASQTANYPLRTINQFRSKSSRKI